MARRSSGGRSSFRPRPVPAARSPPPQTVTRAPPPATAQASGARSFLGVIGTTIADGLGFGAGSSIGHRAVDAAIGPRTIKLETVHSASPVANSMSSGSCDIHSKAFQCINHSGSDISKCQFYMDMLTECRKNSGSVMAA